MGSKNMASNQRSKMSSTLKALGGSEAYGARWTLGALLLAPLAAANSSYCAVPAVMLLAVFMTIATSTCNDLKKLSDILPPTKTLRGRRERNLRSFGDFMAIWMTFLSHLVAVAICARILSATADHVTGGRTRKWLFGYETKTLGEPWPDVLGVTVVMVVCALFMCGLEESVMFTFMLLILLYIFSQFFTIFGLINLDISNIIMPIPITLTELFAAGAPISYAFSVVLPKKDGVGHKKNLFIMIGLPTIIFSGLCFLYTNMLKGNSIDAALPVTTLLEARAAGWICPVLAAVTVSGICLALTELCPSLFTILVTLASPEWKVLTRSMTYESTTTGSPVLAVFTAGSLAAILAFACPLSHMIALMNASHLLGIAIQAFHFIIMRCVPTKEQEDSGLVRYKLLAKAGSSRETKVPGGKTKRGLWLISSAIKHTKTLESIKSKVTSKETEERECLLLDEYVGQSEEMEQITGCSSRAGEITTVDIGDVVSDIEASEPDLSSGDDSTDIDAVVKEYRDRIQVVTAIPESSAPSPPTQTGAQCAYMGAITQLLADILIAIMLCDDDIGLQMVPLVLPLWSFGILSTAVQPAHKQGMRIVQSLQGPFTLLTALVFLMPLMVDSWAALLLFAVAGLIIFMRCEKWCGGYALQQARSVLRRRILRSAASNAPTGTQLTHVDTVYITR